MDVRYSPEQRTLRDAVAQLVGRLGPRTVVGLDDEERRATLDAAVDAAGWRELRAGDDDGAPWSSAVEVAILAEELSHGLADAPFLGPTLAADLRRRAQAPAAAERETIFLAANLSTLGDAVAIDAHGAQHALVLVEQDGLALGRIGLGALEGSSDLTRSAVPRRGAGWDPVPSLGRLTADDLTAWTALGLATTSAELVGSMRGAIDLATGYAKDRRQYGRPVGSFQAVQHLLADALVAMEGARSATLHAAWAVDALSPGEALVAAAVAKAWSARAARSVCETAIQVHGGIGNTWECLAHVHLRRALLSIDVLGGVGPNLERVLVGQGIGDVDGLR